MTDNRTISQLEAEGYPWIGYGGTAGPVLGAVQDDQEKVADIAPDPRPAAKGEFNKYSKQPGDGFAPPDRARKPGFGSFRLWVSHCAPSPCHLCATECYPNLLPHNSLLAPRINLTAPKLYRIAFSSGSADPLGVELRRSSCQPAVDPSGQILILLRSLLAKSTRTSSCPPPSQGRSICRPPCREV